MDYFLHMASAVVLAAIKEAFASPEKATMIKRAMLKIRANIDLLYGDPAQELIKQKTNALDRLHTAVNSVCDAGIINQSQYSAIMTRATISAAHDITEEV